MPPCAGVSITVRRDRAPNPDNVRTGPSVVEHILILGLKADKLVPPVSQRWYDQARFFPRALTCDYIGSNAAEILPVCKTRCSILTTLIKSAIKTIKSVIVTAVRWRFYGLSERQQGRTLNHADRPLSAISDVKQITFFIYYACEHNTC